MDIEAISQYAAKQKFTAQEQSDIAILFSRFTDHFDGNNQKPKLQLGVPLRDVKAWNKGEYKGDTNKVCRAVVRMMDRYYRGLDIDLPFDYVETNICKRVLMVMRDVSVNNTIASVFGPAGIGKTVAAEVAVNGAVERAVHIECTHGSSRSGPFVRMLARRLGARRSYGSVGDVQDAVIDVVREKRQFLIIDEAQYLNNDCINVLRDLVKQAKVGLALLGTIDMDRLIDDGQEFYGQFVRLIGWRYNIAEEEIRYGNGLFSVDEIQSFAKSRGAKITPTAAEALCEYANIPGWGGLGQVGNTLTKAGYLARGQSIKPSHVKAAVQQSHGRSYAARAQNQVAAMKREAAA